MFNVIVNNIRILPSSKLFQSIILRQRITRSDRIIREALVSSKEKKIYIIQKLHRSNETVKTFVSRRSADLIKNDTRPINEARIICNQFSRQEGSCTARDRQQRLVHPPPPPSSTFHTAYPASQDRLTDQKFETRPHLGGQPANVGFAVTRGEKAAHRLELWRETTRFLARTCAVGPFFQWESLRFNVTLALPAPPHSKVPFVYRPIACKTEEPSWTKGGAPFHAIFLLYFKYAPLPLDLEKNICRCSTEKCIFKDARSESGTGRYRLGLRNIGLRNRAEKSSSPPSPPAASTALRMLPPPWHHRTGEGQRMQLG